MISFLDLAVAGFPAHSEANFLIFPNISESELDLLILKNPNISQYFRILQG